MGTQGVFGYILGKKKRFMHVQFDANLLYELLTKELYIIIKHYGSIEYTKNAFDNIKNCDGIPTKEIINKTKYYTNLDVGDKSLSSWYCLLRYCQLSFINILDCGYILNCHDQYGYIFILDFNKNKIIYKFDNLLLKEHEIEDIFKFDNMPSITFDELINNIKINYNLRKNKIDEIQMEINNLLLKYNDLENFVMNRPNIHSKDPKIIELVEAKNNLDSLKWEINNLKDNSYIVNERFKILLDTN